MKIAVKMKIARSILVGALVALLLVAIAVAASTINNPMMQGNQITQGGMMGSGMAKMHNAMHEQMKEMMGNDSDYSPMVEACSKMMGFD